MAQFDPRFRRLLSISLDLATWHRTRAVRNMRRALADRSVRTADVAEAVLHLALLCGVPTCLDGLERLHLVTGRISLRRDTSSHRRGAAAFREIYGSQARAVLNRLRALDPFLERWVVKDVYGTVFSRDGLQLRDRAVFTGIILALQGLSRQSASHIRGALRLGTTPKEFVHWIEVAERRTGVRLTTARKDLARFAR